MTPHRDDHEAVRPDSTTPASAPWSTNSPPRRDVLRAPLVVPDLRGFGRSPRPATGYTPDDHANAVVACLDALGIDDPVTIGAHSLGGLIALHLAASHLGRVAGIVAFGPPLYPDPKVARAHIGGTSTMGRLMVLPGPIAHAACAWVCRPRRLAARLAVRAHPELPADMESPRASQA